MESKHHPCIHCNSLDTEIEVDESWDGENEWIHVEVHCNSCNKNSPFPEELDWKEYV